MKLIILFTFLIILIVNASEKEENGDIFKPTNEWQVVRKGQPIPKGLHVRVNFETGVTEAKLLDVEPENDKNKAISIVPDQEDKEDDKASPSYTLDDIKEAIHKIKPDEEEDSTSDEERNQEILSKFRSIDEIRKDFEEIDMSIKTENQIVEERIELFKILISEMHGEDKDQIFMAVLETIEELIDLVHHIDNAHEFVRLKGIEDIITPHITNQTSIDLQSGLLELLGTLTQNNRKAQIAVLRSNIGTILLNILIIESPESRKKAMFALSSITRGFPLAQYELITKAGGSVLLQILNEEMDKDFKLKMKIVTYIDDLLVEYYAAKQDASDADKLEQYERVNLISLLKEYDYCEGLIGLFVQSIDSGDTRDYDNHEKLLRALESSKKLCGEEYKNHEKYGESMAKLRETFYELSLSEMMQVNDSNTDYYQNLLKTVEFLQFPAVQKKDEL